MPTLQFDRAQNAPSTAPILLLAHGAGAPMDSDFMQTMTAQLTARNISIARFEFAYMAACRIGPGRKPPSKMPLLLQEYREALAALRKRYTETPLLIGGKSMGGRAASMIAAESFDQQLIKGCVCLGYPFHPPNKPDALRTSHLETLQCPTLIVQGERDPFGGRDEVASYNLSPAIQVAWIGDGDHDLKPRKTSGLTMAINLASAADAVAAFALAASKSRRRAK